MTPQTPHKPRLLKNALYGVVPKPGSLEAATPVTLVLQCLTYLCWSMAIIAATVLAAAIMAMTVGPDAESSDFIIYAIVTNLVLLPIALAVDGLYSRRETSKKSGFAQFIMVVFSVVLAVTTIGTLLGAVFALATMAVQSGIDTSVPVIYFWSLVLITALFGALFARVLAPARFAIVRQYFSIGMLVVVALLTLIGIFGPFADNRNRHDDRLVENNLYTIQGNIDSYISARHKLPDSLAELRPSEPEAKAVLERGLITYTPNSKPPTTAEDGQKMFYYQLCTSYKLSSKRDNDYYQYNGYEKDEDYTDAYPSTTPHPAGNVCYKIRAQYYGAN